MFFTSVLIVICVVCVGWRYLFRKISKLEPPAMSGGYPIVGHGLMFFSDSISNYKNLTNLADECLAKGGVTTGYFGFQKAYCIADPEAFLTVANTCLEKEYVYKFGKYFAGEGLMVADESTWKRHRKLLNPAFSQIVLNSFMGIFNNQSRMLVNSLESQLGKPMNHEGTLRLNNLETIFLTATGLSGDSSAKERYISLFPKVQQLLCDRFERLWLHYELIYLVSGLKRKLDHYLKIFVEVSSTIIARKKAEIQANNGTKQNTSGKLKPFLELMLDVTEGTTPLTDKEIRQETDTIIAAGHESLASMVNVALIILGSNPEMQAKVLNEVLEVVGPNRDVNKDDLVKLLYTEAVLKETLRLYPIGPVISRHLDKDVTLKNYILLKGSYCVLFINGLNRHPNWGPDADQFRPERWLETDKLPDLNNFAAFSLGKRNCIGKAYAMMSMKTTLAHLVRSYRITSDFSKVTFRWLLMSYPASGHYYTLEKRY